MSQLALPHLIIVSMSLGVLPTHAGLIILKIFINLFLLIQKSA